MYQIHVGSKTSKRLDHNLIKLRLSGPRISKSIWHHVQKGALRTRRTIYVNEYNGGVVNASIMGMWL